MQTLVVLFVITFIAQPVLRLFTHRYIVTLSLHE